MLCASKLRKMAELARENSVKPKVIENYKVLAEVLHNKAINGENSCTVNSREYRAESLTSLGYNCEVLSVESDIDGKPFKYLLKISW